MLKVTKTPATGRASAPTSRGFGEDSQTSLLNQLYSVPGRQILDRILDHPDPQRYIRALPCEDFFWLIKKVGEDDCVPLLELASTHQWQYMLDLEIWSRDRIHPQQTMKWLKRLSQADIKRLAAYLTGEGELLARYYFWRAIEVVYKPKDEPYDLPEGFFTADGTLYVRAVDPEHRDLIEDILRTMARENFDDYLGLLQALGGVLPAETEEELYRQRNLRLSEHGFLPFEEAVSVYTPLDPEAIEAQSPKLQAPEREDDLGASVPLGPLYHAATPSLLTEATSTLDDPILADRLRMEFAGLSNQILAADGLPVYDAETLKSTCQKAAGYINIALERLCGKDARRAQELLKHQALLSIFRIGFGLALKVKWEATRWLKGSWFSRQELNNDFWGTDWGGLISGLLLDRPKYYDARAGDEDFRDFQHLSELRVSMDALHRVIVLDGLLERVANRFSLEDSPLGSSDLTFHPLLFNLWARVLLDLQPSLSGITISQARAFFAQLRAKERTPPFKMPGFREQFIAYFTSFSTSPNPEAAETLKDTLSVVWQWFRKEYQWVPLEQLDPRFISFITILPDPTPDRRS